MATPTQRTPRTGSADAERRRAVDDAARRLGIEQLHSEQEEVIRDVLDGRDVLMILPTGFGKSACYQIPSMVLPRPVVLISPLLALIRDQHEKLVKRDIPCVRIDGTVRGKAREAAFERLREGGPLLLMTTPETAATEEMGEALAVSGVSLAAVDEAHCISEWGHDFRPSYLRLGARLRELGAPSVLALTATATERVRDSIVRSLGMREPEVVAASPHRSNLAFDLLHAEGDYRPRALMRLVKRLRRPGIVYCATTREVDQIYVLLRRFKITAHRYHGKMKASERNAEQERYMRRGHRSVMVATNAFGLGIDKPDIRFVLHYQSPASLEQYVQEAGRAGRDGRRANGILLWDPADRTIHEALLARSRVRPEQLYRLGSALAAWADEQRDPSLEALALSAEMGPRIAAALLTKVEEAGLVARDGDAVRILGEAASIEARTNELAAQFETLKTQDGRRLDWVERYARNTGCRAVFLQDYFGEETGEPCGLCDVCLGRAERPETFFEPLVAPVRKKSPRKKRGRRSTGRGRSRRGGRSRRRPADGEAQDAPAARKRAAGKRGAARGEGANGADAAEGEDVKKGRRRRGRRGSRGGRRRRGRRGAPEPSSPPDPPPPTR